MKGTVSLIIPLYNREELILETLHSIDAQTYTNFECIIIDDGSTDNSLEVVGEFIKGKEKFILRSRSGDKKGASSCRNEGIALATGEFMMFLDSDDLLGVNCFETRVKAMSEHRECDFIVNQAGIFNHSTYRVTSLWSSLKHQHDLNAFVYSEGWCISNTFFRSEFVKRYKFNEDALNWQDVEFHMRLLLDRPRYEKFPANFPDVFIRRSSHVRISNSNIHFDRIEARIRLLITLEKLMELKGYNEYRRPFLVYHFKFLEIAALVLEFSEFRHLYQLWKTSRTSKNRGAWFYASYLEVQTVLKRIGLRPVCSILYRVIRLFISKDLLYARKREVILNDNAYSKYLQKQLIASL